MLQHFTQLHPWLALGVIASTAATDAVYVFFTASVSNRRRLSAATWSSVWYLLSSFAVITYTKRLDLRDLRRAGLVDRRVLFDVASAPAAPNARTGCAADAVVN